MHAPQLTWTTAVDTPIGRFEIRGDPEGIRQAGFDLAPPPVDDDEPEPLTLADPLGAGAAFSAWFAGDLGALDPLPLAPVGTAFGREVWRLLRAIPNGSTITYAELARRLGRPSATRAVAGANARNPIAVAIPCHRIVAVGGRLGGYAGGLWRKRWLLAHEGAPGYIVP